MLVNLTRHDVVVILPDGSPVTIEPSGTEARCAVQRETIGYLDLPDGRSVPLHKTVFGEVENLPEPKAETWYIVSRAVASACPDRYDLIIPDDTVRDEKGRIVGCRAFARPD